MFHLAQYFLETRAVTLFGFVFQHNCYGDAVLSMRPARSGGPEKAPTCSPGNLGTAGRTWPGAVAGQGPPFLLVVAHTQVRLVAQEHHPSICELNGTNCSSWVHVPSHEPQQ